MKNASAYRVGGYALLAGAILLGIGILLQPQAPESVRAASEAVTGLWVRWMLSYWMLVLGTAIVFAGWSGISKQFGDGPHEGLAMIAFALILLGSVAMLGVFASRAVALPMLLDMYRSNIQTISEQAYRILGVTGAGMERAGGMLTWLGVAIFGFIFSRDSAWPVWLGYSGIAAGVVEVLAVFALTDNPTAWRLVSFAGFTWIALAGAHVTRAGTGRRARSQVAAVR